MNRQQWIFVAVGLLLIAATAGALAHLRGNQKLGRPGVKTRPIAESRNLEVLLPEHVLDYSSEPVAEDKIVVDILPKDTSYGQRRYTAPDGSWTVVNVVLMGSDRTSIHKPQFCLEGAGWKIDSTASNRETVRVDRPFSYDLPVMKLVSTKDVTVNGQTVRARGVFVYWFVTDNAISGEPAGFQRMWWIARELLRTGELQRWAYVSFFSVCWPGQETAAFERMKKLIAASVPEFQLTPRPQESVTAAQP